MTSVEQALQHPGGQAAAELPPDFGLMAQTLGATIAKITGKDGAVNDEKEIPQTSEQREGLARVMQQSYIEATQMARAMGYHTLEHMELHRQAQSKANTKGKRSNPNTVFVGGLKKETEDDAVKNHFDQYGEITRCDVIRNLDGTSRGFAFVKFATKDETDKCLDAKFDHIIDGKWCNVRLKDNSAADTGKQAAQAVEMAAAAVGVEPSQYLNYLTHLAMVKYGYGKHDADAKFPQDKGQPKPRDDGPSGKRARH